jgi:hypothetical protein
MYKGFDKWVQWKFALHQMGGLCFKVICKCTKDLTSGFNESFALHQMGVLCFNVICKCTKDLTSFSLNFVSYRHEHTLQDQIGKMFSQDWQLLIMKSVSVSHAPPGRVTHWLIYMMMSKDLVWKAHTQSVMSFGTLWSQFLLAGVFYCGPMALAKELELLSRTFSQKSTTKFEFHKESFWWGKQKRLFSRWMVCVSNCEQEDCNISHE